VQPRTPPASAAKKASKAAAAVTAQAEKVRRIILAVCETGDNAFRHAAAFWAAQAAKTATAAATLATAVAASAAATVVRAVTTASAAAATLRQILQRVSDAQFIRDTSYAASEALDPTPPV
jgi:hypothetical protein